MPTEWSLSWNSDTDAWVSFSGWKYSACCHTWMCQEDNTSLRTMEASHLEPSQTSPYAFLLLAGWVQHFRWVLWSLSSKLSNLKESLGTPKFVPIWSEVRVSLGTPKLAAGVRNLGQTWQPGRLYSTCKAWPNPGEAVIQEMQGVIGTQKRLSRSRLG